MLRSNSKTLGNHVVSFGEKKRKAAVGRVCRKGKLGLLGLGLNKSETKLA